MKKLSILIAIFTTLISLIKVSGNDRKKLSDFENSFITTLPNSGKFIVISVKCI
jgi:hypothetical protein